MAYWKWTSMGIWSHRLLKTGLFQRTVWPIPINSAKESNGWLLKGKNMGKSRRKTLWQVFSTRRIRNLRPSISSKNLSKAWMIMSQEKPKTSQRLVSKPLMIIPFNIPWASLKASGILRPRWGSWCRSTKNSWNPREMITVKEPLRLVSSTADLIWSNPSLRNLLRY